MNRSIWRGSSKKTTKPWGTEREWSGLFSGKEIVISAGNRTSLKFNTRKNELLFLQAGNLYVEYADESHFHDYVKHPSKSCVLDAGDFLNIQAGCPYRLSALTDCVIFELSDTIISERVVIDDDYGRETNKSGGFIFKRPDS